MARGVDHERLARFPCMPKHRGTGMSAVPPGGWRRGSRRPVELDRAAHGRDRVQVQLPAGGWRKLLVSLRMDGGVRYRAGGVDSVAVAACRDSPSSCLPESEGKRAVEGGSRGSNADSLSQARVPT